MHNNIGTQLFQATHTTHANATCILHKYIATDVDFHIYLHDVAHAHKLRIRNQYSRSVLSSMKQYKC